VTICDIDEQRGRRAHRPSISTPYRDRIPLSIYLPAISSPTFDMSYQSGSSHLCVLFEPALKDYKQQTGIELAKHPLAERLQDCNTVESVTAVLREQAQDFKEFREKDKVLKPLKKVLTVLHMLPSAADFAQRVGLVCP
jgi:hypothetical protein